MTPLAAPLPPKAETCHNHGMLLLVQFLFRTSFGLTAAMASVSPRQVTSGYYRNHLYVVLGMNFLGLLAALSDPERFHVTPAAVAAALTYVGAVVWLYEGRQVGRVLLAAVAIVSLVGAWLATPGLLGGSVNGLSPAALLLKWADAPSAGLLLGTTLAAMFLGHWYLNTPTMELTPLRRLLALMMGAIVLRAIVCGVGLALQYSTGTPPQAAFLALRWLAGLIGVAGLAAMAWATLKIPNTQSATGILYVAVVGVFIGELTSQLLSANLLFPV